MKKFVIVFIGLILILLTTECYRTDLPPVSISFLAQHQTLIGSDSTVTPDLIQVDYYIYNNTPHIINQCEVNFIVYYTDNTFEIIGPDITTEIRDHQRNDFIIFTDKFCSYVDVHSVYITGVGQCKYNIISR